MEDAWTKPPTVPPVKLMSSIAKLAEGSDSVKETMEVRVPPMELGAATMERTVGATVSMVIGVAIPPARLLLPAASVNVAAATEIEPGAVELAVGVKIAV